MQVVKYAHIAVTANITDEGFFYPLFWVDENAQASGSLITLWKCTVSTSYHHRCQFNTTSSQVGLAIFLMHYGVYLFCCIGAALLAAMLYVRIKDAKRKVVVDE